MKSLDSFLLCVCAFCLISCESFPVTPIVGKVCYTTSDGAKVCLGSDGKAINVDANFSGK